MIAVSIISDTRWRRLPILAVAILLAACGNGGDSPEDRLRSDIDAIQQAAESRDISEFMAYVSDEYNDDGNRIRKDIRALTQLQFIRNPRIHTFKVIQRLDIVDERRASVSILAALAGRPIDSVSALSGLRADLMRFDLESEFEDQWKITSARWAPAEIANFPDSG